MLTFGKILRQIMSIIYTLGIYKLQRMSNITFSIWGIGLLMAISFNPTLHGQQVIIKKDRSIFFIDSLQDYGEYYQFKLKGTSIQMYMPHSAVVFIDKHKGPIERFKDPRMFRHQKTMALKLSPTALSNNSLYLSLEKSFTPRWGAEVGIRIHSKSNNDFFITETSGIGIELGGKFRVSNPYLIKKNKIRHLLGGLYLKPTLGYSSKKETTFENIDQYQLFYGGINSGLQFLIKDVLVIDLYAGIYLYTADGESTPIGGQFTIPFKVKPKEGDFIGENNLATSLGVKFGFLLGSRK